VNLVSHSFTDVFWQSLHSFLVHRVLVGKKSRQKGDTGDEVNESISSSEIGDSAETDESSSRPSDEL